MWNPSFLKTKQELPESFKKDEDEGAVAAAPAVALRGVEAERDFERLALRELQYDREIEEYNRHFEPVPKRSRRGMFSNECPAMPCVLNPPPEIHRQKIAPDLGIPACVARPVPKKEMLANERAIAAMHKEWNRLRDKGAWDESVVRPWKEVAREAQKHDKYASLRLPRDIPTFTASPL